MRLETVRRYAQGKAPFLGVPVFSLTAGRYITAVFRREHLKAACECPYVRKAVYDEVNHLLVLNGGKSFWKLRDVKATGQIGQLWINDANITWARQQRERVTRVKLAPEERRILKLEDAIRKLEKQRDKIYLRVPVGPMAPCASQRYNESWREDETRWQAEKPMRRKLGWLAHRERKTWAQFYRDAAAILGREMIFDGYRHDRVCHRKGGPGIFTYMKGLPKYIGMAHKPYTHGRTWEPYKALGYGEDHELNEFQRHRKAQLEYLAAKRERDALANQIEQYQLEIQESGTEVA